MIDTKGLKLVVAIGIESGPLEDNRLITFARALRCRTRAVGVVAYNCLDPEDDDDGDNKLWD
jgi:hypothetical protein